MLQTKVKTETKQNLGAAVGGEAELRAEIIEIKNTIESGFLILARGLAEVFSKKLYIGWGFPTYESYVKTELDFSYRKAKFLTDIWGKVVELGLPQDKISKMGWSKAVELIKVLTPENVDLWMEKASDMSLSKLEAEVKDEIDRSVGDSRPKITTMIFKLDSADSGIVSDAITEAKKIHETESDVLALSQICGEWLLLKGKSPVRTTIDDYIEFIGRTYGVALTIAGGAQPVEKKRESKVLVELDDADIDSMLQEND